MPNASQTSHFSARPWNTAARVFVGHLCCFVVAFHGVTIAHETLGHGLMATLWGAELEELYVSWMGAAGYARWQEGTLEAAGRPWVAWGGILCTSLLAAIGYASWRPRPNRWSTQLRWSLLVALSASSFGYTILGLHFRYGDPAQTANELETMGVRGIVVCICVLVHCALVYFQSRDIARRASLWFIGTSRLAQLTLVVVLVGGPVATVAAANRIESQITAQGARMATIMRPRWMKEVERRLETWRIDYEQQRGASPTQAQIAEMRRRLVAQARPWRIDWFVYFPGLSLATFAGLTMGIRANRAMPGATPPRLPVWLWGLAIASVLASGLISAMY